MTRYELRTREFILEHALELSVPAQGARSISENLVRADTRLTAHKISEGHTGSVQAAT